MSLETLKPHLRMAKGAICFTVHLKKKIKKKENISGKFVELFLSFQQQKADRPGLVQKSLQDK